MSKIITFYSYKGGVGRSMALANIGVLLSKWGYKTLLIDWDLEAPGLENFFNKYLNNPRKVLDKTGVIDILYSSYGEIKNKIKWQDCIVPFVVEDNKNAIHLITAGKRDQNYLKRLRGFSVPEFYDKHNGGIFIEQLRDDLLKAYDFILIDSRTGVTDFGGVCTIQLPDILSSLTRLL